MSEEKQNLPESKTKTKIIAGAFWMLVLLLIAVRFYKAHNTGIIHDEYWTLRDFCTDIKTALTNYSSTNNHILNSISIIITRLIFGNYEHFVRIHSCLWSVVFCLSVGWLILNAVRSRLVQFLLLVIILTNWFIFDLSYLARGYSMGLGICFFTLAVYCHIIRNKDLAVISQWKFILLLILTNFISIGSMLSSVNIVFAINSIYVVLLVMLWYQKRLSLKGGCLRLTVLVAGSGVSLYMLYANVLTKLKQSTAEFEGEPLLVYVKKALWDPFIKLSMINHGLVKNCELWLMIVLCFVGLCFIIMLLSSVVLLKKNKAVSLTPAVFLSAVFVITVGFKLFQNLVAGISLGMPRNSVFTLVLLIMACGIIIDSVFQLADKNKVTRAVFSLAVLGVLVPFVWINNLPSLNAINIRPFDWGKQSAVGPLVRKLKENDSSRFWNVRLDGYADCLRGPIDYYKNFGYKVNRTKDNNFDVIIVRPHEKDGRVQYFSYDYFTDFNCCVIINPNMISVMN